MQLQKTQAQTTTSKHGKDFPFMFMLQASNLFCSVHFFLQRGKLSVKQREEK